MRRLRNQLFLGAVKALYPWPALGMFEVFGRTGPPTLGGGRFWTLQCNKMRLQPGFRPAEPAGGDYIAPPEALAGFKGPLQLKVHASYLSDA